MSARQKKAATTTTPQGEPKPRSYAAIRREMAEYHHRRQEALQAIKDGRPSGLVPVRCGTCRRPIATTSVDQKKGEPPILLEFPENATGWTCIECSAAVGA